MSKSSGGATNCAPTRLKGRYEEVIPFLFCNATHLHPPNPPLIKGEIFSLPKDSFGKAIALQSPFSMANHPGSSIALLAVPWFRRFLMLRRFEQSRFLRFSSLELQRTRV